MFSRRAFLAGGLATAAAPESAAAVDARERVSRADLIYEKPAARSEEGMPVGNGRMGTLAWTSPSSLKFQINRVDVYPINSATTSFFERNSDYCGGCGFVDIDFGGIGEDVFPASGFRQRLSVYDGVMSVEGNGVTARLLVWHAQDVMAVEVEDRRASPDAGGRESSDAALRLARLRPAAGTDGQGPHCRGPHTASHGRFAASATKASGSC